MNAVRTVSGFQKPYGLLTQCAIAVINNYRLFINRFHNLLFITSYYLPDKKPVEIPVGIVFFDYTCRNKIVPSEKIGVQFFAFKNQTGLFKGDAPVFGFYRYHAG